MLRHQRILTLNFLYIKNQHKTDLQPVSMTCGTGSLFWRVGRRCKIHLVPRLCRQTNIQDTSKLWKNISTRGGCWAPGELVVRFYSKLLTFFMFFHFTFTFTGNKLAKGQTKMRQEQS